MVQFFNDQTRYRVVFMNKFRSKHPVFQSEKSLKKEAKIIDILAILSRTGLKKLNYKEWAGLCIKY